MSFEVACSCGQRFLAEEYLDGKEVRCPSCRSPLAIERIGHLKKLLVNCHCGQQFKVDADMQGKQVACPNCLVVQEVTVLTAYLSPGRPPVPLPQPLSPWQTLGDGFSTRTIRTDLPGRSDAEFKRMLLRTVWIASTVSVIAILLGVVYGIVIPSVGFFAQVRAPDPDPSIQADETVGEEVIEPRLRNAGRLIVSDTTDVTPEGRSPDKSELGHPRSARSIVARRFANPVESQPEREEPSVGRSRVEWVRTSDEFADTANLRASLPRALARWSEDNLSARRGLRKVGTTDYPIYHYSWMCELLPFIGREQLYQQFRFGEAYTEADNFAVASRVIPEFLNPSDSRTRWEGIYYQGLGLTHFAGMSGIEDARNVVAAELPRRDPRAGVFGYDHVAKADDITDGLSNTLMMVGSGELAGPWVMGGGATIRGARRPYFDRHTGLGSQGLSNGAGTLTVLADGSVRFISATVDAEVFRAMCTIRGGESVDISSHTAPARLDPKR